MDARSLRSLATRSIYIDRKRSRPTAVSMAKTWQSFTDQGQPRGSGAGGEWPGPPSTPILTDMQRCAWMCMRANGTRTDPRPLSRSGGENRRARGHAPGGACDLHVRTRGGGEATRRMPHRRRSHRIFERRVASWIRTAGVAAIRTVFESPIRATLVRPSLVRSPSLRSPSVRRTLVRGALVVVGH